MATRISFPNTVTQTTGGKYATWSGLQNIKSNTGSNYAITVLVKGKSESPNRPSTVMSMNYKLSIPEGSKVSSIKVEYVHDLQGYNSKYPSIPAPTISLVNVGGTYSKKGVAPGTALTTGTVTFTPKNDNDFNTTYLNNSRFGVNIDYPTNTSNNSGYVRLRFVRVTVTYTEPNFNVTWESQSSVEQDSTFDTTLVVSNKNLTNYIPTLTILTPAGFGLKNEPSGDGTWTKIENRKYTWKPNFTSQKGSISLGLTFNVNVSGTLPVTSTFEAIEDTTNLDVTKTVTVTEKTTYTSVETEELPQELDLDVPETVNGPLRVMVTERFMVSKTLTDEEAELLNEYEPGKKVGSFYIFSNPYWLDDYTDHYNNTTGKYEYDDSLFVDGGQAYFDSDNVLSVVDTSDGKLGIDANAGAGEYTLVFLGGDEDWEDGTISVDAQLETYNIQAYPNNLSAPSSTILYLSDEELDRLGDGYSYTAQTNYQVDKATTAYTNNTETSKTDGGDANNNTILTTVENLPSTFELSFDFKTTGESRFYIGASDYATDRNPNYSVFIGSPNGSNKCYYGTRTTSTSATDITLDPTTYHSMKITRRGSTFIFNLDGKQYSTTVTWFDNYTTYKIGINIWGNGTVYCKNVKLLTGNIDSYVRDWGKNYRIGVFNNPIAANITNYNVIDKDGETTSITYDTTNYDNLTINDIIQNAEYWSDTVAKLGTFHDLNVTFPYNRDYPLYIIITGDYSSATYPASVRFTEPCIIEATEYLGREPNGNYLEPIRNLLTTNESTINIGTYESSAPFVFYDFDVGEDYGTNTEMAIRGIGIELTIENYDNCVLSAQLRSPTGTIGERSVDIEASMLDENNILRIGGIGDTWNFNTLDLVDLADWEIRLTLLNILTETETTISADNAQLIFYVEQVTSQRDFAYINGEDIRYYGAFVSDIDIPAGLKMSTSFLNVDGTDTNDAYRQNIREKEITLELEIGDNCDLEMATNSLRQLTQLILNKRDKYNRPIPKTISFSFMPDVYFEYIVEDTFDNPIEISSYNIKVKLTVPSGTAYKKNATTTNTTGYVQGLAKVNPIISIKPTGTEIEVKETQTNQKWNITLPETPEGIIVIDTENRKAYTQTDEDSTDQTDISKYVDFNSDWFILQDEYTFTSNNAYIRSVTYTERW